MNHLKYPLSQRKHLSPPLLSRKSHLSGSITLFALAWAVTMPTTPAFANPAYYGMVSPSGVSPSEEIVDGEAGSAADADLRDSPILSRNHQFTPPSSTIPTEFFSPEFSTTETILSQSVSHEGPEESSPDRSSTEEPMLEERVPEEPENSADSVSSPATDSPEFGDAGQDRWYVQGAGATTFENEFGMVGAGLSHFFINGHSVNLELNGMAFSQTGEDAVGANLALIMRWHFVREQNWSIYIDGGAGLLGTTNDVPSTGSSFNFTPQAGGGATVRLSDDRHLMMGLRWHHISNAELYEGNPGRDSIMGYVGVNFPR